MKIMSACALAAAMALMVPAAAEAQNSGTAPGAVGGAVVGGVVGGPVGAIIGGVAGASLGTAITPPPHVVTYVEERPVDPVVLEGDVVVGAGLPEVVTLHPVPDYEYQYAVVNDREVLVDPATRRIVYVF